MNLTPNDADIRARMADLEVQVTRHDRLYHEVGAPEITDADYDRLRVELERLEALHPHLASDLSPTRRVGGAPARWLSHRRLAEPMRSLRKVRSTVEWEEYASWVADRLDLPDYELAWSLEPKLDGVALEAVYEGGRLVSACTRGDGCLGEDVTRNARLMLPERLSNERRLVIHGEVVIPWNEFQALNERRAKSFDSPRTAVQGALRGNARDEVHERGLRFLAWENHTHVEQAHFDRMNALSVAGIDVVRSRTIRLRNPREVLAEARDHWVMRWSDPEGCNLACDGMVLKLDSMHHRRALGSTSTAPRWAVALKL
ncbi:hypothetical protein [Desulfovibrio aminophilus]|uniref:hypothetical protein n=1 Tax=Desulfovibrio aminophilus TaxID=81425 RepID=UPI0003F6BE32|nr:hypothetical protein [Desulfovibrio aminophilus]